jgi:hypothetical protein
MFQILVSIDLERVQPFSSRRNSLIFSLLMAEEGFAHDSTLRQNFPSHCNVRRCFAA